MIPRSPTPGADTDKGSIAISLAVETARPGPELARGPWPWWPREAPWSVPLYAPAPYLAALPKRHLAGLLLGSVTGCAKTLTGTGQVHREARALIREALHALETCLCQQRLQAPAVVLVTGLRVNALTGVEPHTHA
jgi:hypothetical protein